MKGGRPSLVWLAWQLAAAAGVMALLLFVPAGTWTWARGWMFFAVMLVAMIGVTAWLWWVNPEIFEARRRIRRGTKGWDLALAVILLPTMIAILPLAALDDGRFRWLPTPWWVSAIGSVLLLGGTALLTWAQAVNRFFEPGVRIQTDRGHVVVDRGPYAIVRHPGYDGVYFLLAGMALSLGSIWALAPAGLASLVLVVRTVWEDRTLRNELPGYEEYARRVRYRAVPGVW